MSLFIRSINSNGNSSSISNNSNTNNSSSNNNASNSNSSSNSGVGSSSINSRQRGVSSSSRMWVFGGMFCLVAFTAWSTYSHTYTHTPSHTPVYSLTPTDTLHAPALPLLPACESLEWCSIPMPSNSHFRGLSAPTDALRWRRAQAAAAEGQHVLLRKAMRRQTDIGRDRDSHRETGTETEYESETLPHSESFVDLMDLLDGDIKTAHYHSMADHFLDKKHGLLEFVQLKEGMKNGKDKNRRQGRRHSAGSVSRRLSDSGPSTTPTASSLTSNDGESQMLVMPSGLYPPEIPGTYMAHLMQRAPIVQLGYTRFERLPGEDYFKGTRLEDVNILRPKLFEAWREAKQQSINGKFTTPLIFMSNLNENWGLMSMVVPNRTIDWISCCTVEHYRQFKAILDDDQTIAFFIQQHHNMSHPKLLATPRGMSVQDHNMRIYIWDLMHTLPYDRSKRKTSLLYTASSNWGHRPILKKCISSKFNSSNKAEIEFDSYEKNLAGRVQEVKYYQKLANARMTIALPGLGYDTYRLWESLTLGLVPVVERGIGLEKTLWKLPVLFVDDYAEVTPTLLRSAYVEALYQVDNFEFERLSQSWWYSLILQTSVAKNSALLQQKFPPESEELAFTRPAKPFTCWKTNSCGAGTKKIPKVSC